MKNLQEIEDRIKEYFDNISPEELLKKATEEYGFEVVDPIIAEFSTMSSKDKYSDVDNSTYYHGTDEGYIFAA